MPLRYSVFEKTRGNNGKRLSKENNIFKKHTKQYI